MTALRLTYVASLLVGLGYLIVGQGYSLGTLEMPGEGIYPTVMGTFFTCLSLAGVIKSLCPEEGQSHTAAVFPRGIDLRRVFYIALSLALFAILFRHLGFSFCATVLMLTVLRILGPWSWPKTVLASVVLVGLSYLLFAELLGVPLPQGSVWG
jgi:hypothetical protein